MCQKCQSAQQLNSSSSAEPKGADAPLLGSIGDVAPNRVSEGSEDPSPEAEFHGFAERYDLLHDIVDVLRQGGVEGSTLICGAAANRIGSPQIHRRRDKSSGDIKVRFKRICYCKSGFRCPVCAVWLAGVRAGKLRKILLASVAREGHSVAFMTLGIGHDLWDTLDSLVSVLAGSWLKVTRSGSFTRLREKFGLIGVIFAWDYTWSAEFGHHPHLHILVVSSRSNADEAAEILCDVFLDNVHAEGRYATKDAQDIQLLDFRGCNGSSDLRKVAAYLAKGPDGVVGGLPWELSGSERDTRSQQSLTAFGLARRAAAGDADAARLFCEYATAFKGRRSCVIRNAIWEPALDIDLGPDEAQQHPDDDDGEVWQLFGSLPTLVWNAVRARRKLGYLARLVKAGLPFVEVLAQAKAIAVDRPEFGYWTD